MKKTKIFSIAAILSLACFYGQKASAECATVTAGIKPTGHIFYNADYGVLQVCRADGVWQAISPKECPAGDGCSGGGSTSCTSPWGGPDISHGNSVTAYETASVPFGETCNDENRTCDDGDLSGSFTFASCNVGAPADCTLDGLTVPHGDSETFYSAEEHANCASVSQSRTCTDGTLDGSGSYQYASCEPPAGPTGCDNIGDVCSDGSVYAGLSPDGNVKMYTTPADQGGYPWNNGNSSNFVTTNQTSNITGQSNTANLITIDSDSGTGGTQPHQAAQACADLSAHGHTDWYLPARDELNVLYTNRAAIGGFNTSGSFPAGYYWSSSEYDDYRARNQSFSDGGQPNLYKNNGLSVRCVRR